MGSLGTKPLARQGQGRNSATSVISEAHFAAQPYRVASITPVIHFCMAVWKLMKIQQAWDRIQSQFQSLYTAEEAVGLGGTSLLDCVIFGRVTGVACARNVLSDRVKVTSLAVLANDGKAERLKSDQAIVVGGDWADTSAANAVLGNISSVVLLDKSSF